ncbi:MAG: biopolymer transporter ExbD [Verrucomicrobiales bacterium]|nr:biopolymer transporter ExbD [Verrucomicrobiales bacterium]
MKRDLRRIRLAHHSSLSELNITPLLDLVFVLLVIFIIASPQLSRHLPLSLPRAESGGGSPPPYEPLVIEVDERGQTHVDGQLMSEPALRRLLSDLRAATPERGVVVRGANAMPYQGMIDVLDLLHELRVEKIGLATESADSPKRSP